MKTETPKPKWSDIKPILVEFDQKSLLGLIKDLFDASAENRTFLTARFQNDRTADWALEEYRRRIIEQFYPKRGFGNPKTSTCRKVISEFKKARGDLGGLAELMLTFVETGTEFAREYGWDEEALYDSLGSMFVSLVQLLSTDEGMYVYIRLRTRFESLAKASNDVGYGLGYVIGDGLAILECRCSEWCDQEQAD